MHACLHSCLSARLIGLPASADVPGHGMFRSFPNGETFEIMGYKYDKIHKPGPYTILKVIPHGEELPDLKVYTAEELAKNKRKLTANTGKEERASH